MSILEQIELAALRVSSKHRGLDDERMAAAFSDFAHFIRLCRDPTLEERQHND